MKNLSIVRTVNKIKYNPLRKDVEDFIGFVIEPKNLFFDYIEKSFTIKLTTYIVQEVETFEPLYDEDGNPILLENGNHDFIEKKIDKLTRLELPKPLGGKYSADDIDNMIKLLKSQNVITDTDNELDTISKALIHGVMLTLSNDENLTLNLNDLKQYTIRT